MSSDFDKALGKVKWSVSENDRELARVWDRNDEYGEIKKQKKNHITHLARMNFFWGTKKSPESYLSFFY